MKIKHTNDHTVEFVDDAAMSFIALTVHRLNEALRANGMPDSASRQEVCSRFLFEFAYQLDAGWFMEGDVRLYPKVCFAERAKLKDDENLGEIETLHVPTEASSWHEYAHGVVSQYFEGESEGKPPVRTGSYENEDPGGI
jgi:hypothetical protein